MSVFSSHFKLIAVLFLSVTFLIGCSKDDGALAPENEQQISNLTVQTEPEIITNEDGSYSTVTAILTNEHGDPVQEGTEVFFQATLGSIQESAVTNAQGEAVVQFIPDSETGDVEITAVTDGVGGPVEGGGRVCVVDPAVPISIELTSDRSEIDVAGTGGTSTALITAHVNNGIGEPVTEEYDVTFELIGEPNPPAGCILNGVDQEDVVRTVNGIAAAGLNAGTRIGTVLIRVSVHPQGMQEIDAIFSPVVVTCGPPFQLDLDVNDIGVDAGGGAWKIGVTARVWDIHRNPVADGLPVAFTVEPEIANISVGFTGNESLEGESQQGLAHGILVYHSVNTFDAIEIGASISTAQGEVTGSREHQLPLQQGQLNVHVDPGNWMFEEDREQADIRVWAVLRDGHGILINGAPVLFQSTRGGFWWKQYPNDRWNQFSPEPARAYTGLVDREHNENPGQATVYLRVEEDNIFLDPFTLEVTVRIEAQIENNDDILAEPQFVYFTRRG